MSITVILYSTTSHTAQTNSDFGEVSAALDHRKEEVFRSRARKCARTSVNVHIDTIYQPTNLSVLVFVCFSQAGNVCELLNSVKMIAWASIDRNLISSFGSELTVSGHSSSSQSIKSIKMSNIIWSRLHTCFFCSVLL